MKKTVIAIVGPTAVGKTSLSLDIAEKYDAEIISVDSMQIYRHMDIGTAKPTQEELSRVPHHLIDFLEPDQTYDAGKFVTDAKRIIHDIWSRGKTVMLVGGTGLYLKRLQEGLFQLPPIDEKIRLQVKKELEEKGNMVLYAYLQEIDPESAKRIHPNDSQRLSRGVEIYRATGTTWSQQLKKQKPENILGDTPLLIYLDSPRDSLYAKINRRVDSMLAEGLEGEVQNLLKMGYSVSLNSMRSIGYRHMIHYLNGDWDQQTMHDTLARDTRRYAKRQITWFKKVKDLQWMAADRHDRIINWVEAYVGQR